MRMWRWKFWRPGDHPRARWLAPVVPAALAFALLVAACGGSSGRGTEGVASAGGTRSGQQSKDRKNEDPHQAALKYAQCMREHGVDMPDPQASYGLIRVAPGDGAGPDGPVEEQLDESFAEAEKACRHLLDDLVQDHDAPADPKEQDRALKFAQCMRDHGIDMPDPDFSGGGVTIKITGVDPQSQTFKDAQKACGDAFGPGGEPGLQSRAGGKA